MEVKKTLHQWTQRTRRKVLESTALTYDLLKSSWYTWESLPYPILKNIARGQFAQLDFKSQKIIFDQLLDLHKKDSRCIAEHLPNFSMVQPQKIFNHLFRLPQMYFEEVKATIQCEDDTHKFHPYPHYYAEYHHHPMAPQTYDHYLEWMFKGAADGLRRQMIGALKNRYPHSQGEGLNLLEVGAGVGKLSYWLKQVFPKARIVVQDLNSAYLKEAQKNLSEFYGVDYIQSDASELPFQEGNFDVVLSSFLFHEVPLEIRKKILKEMHRVLRNKGAIVLLDSMQKEDFSALKLPTDLSPYQESSFWLDYLTNSLEGMIDFAGFELDHKNLVFFSKVLSGHKKS